MCPAWSLGSDALLAPAGIGIGPKAIEAWYWADQLGLVSLVPKPISGRSPLPVVKCVHNGSTPMVSHTLHAASVFGL